MNKYDKLRPLFKITLSPELEHEEKLQILIAVYNKIEEYIMHFDNLRSKNFNFALVIFAALFSIGIYLNTPRQRIIVSTVITVFMIMFLLIERKYHKYSHGFQTPSYQLIHEMANINKKSPITIIKFDEKYASEAEKYSLQAVIYYLLILGGILSYFIFPLIKAQ